EVALGPLRLQGQVALARPALADPRHLLAVDVQLDDAVVGDDLVVVPLAAALGPVLARQAARRPRGVRAVGLAGRAVDAEQVAVAGGRHRARLAVLVFQVHEDLHLDAARVRRTDARQRVRPDEKAGVADFLRVDVHPLEVGDEVLVLAGRAEEARRLAG